MNEVEALRTELEHYKTEKEKIRDLIGQAGGRTNKKKEIAINVIFLVLVIGFFALDVINHMVGARDRFLPPMLLMEIAVLLVSVKIIWMIYTQTKVDHFQFWVLNSIEFQMNMITRRITEMEKSLKTIKSSVEPEEGEKKEKDDS